MKIRWEPLRLPHIILRYNAKILNPSYMNLNRACCITQFYALFLYVYNHLGFGLPWTPLKHIILCLCSSLIYITTLHTLQIPCWPGNYCFFDFLLEVPMWCCILMIDFKHVVWLFDLSFKCLPLMNFSFFFYIYFTLPTLFQLIVLVDCDWMDTIFI